MRMRPIAAVHIVTGRIFSSAFPEQSLQTAPAKRALSVKEMESDNENSDPVIVYGIMAVI